MSNNRYPVPGYGTGMNYQMTSPYYPTGTPTYPVMGSQPTQASWAGTSTMSAQASVAMGYPSVSRQPSGTGYWGGVSDTKGQGKDYGRNAASSRDGDRVSVKRRHVRLSRERSYSPARNRRNSSTDSSQSHRRSRSRDYDSLSGSKRMRYDIKRNRNQREKDSYHDGDRFTLDSRRSLTDGLYERPRRSPSPRRKDGNGYYTQRQRSFRNSPGRRSPVRNSRDYSSPIRRNLDRSPISFDTSPGRSSFDRSPRSYQRGPRRRSPGRRSRDRSLDRSRERYDRSPVRRSPKRDTRRDYSDKRSYRRSVSPGYRRERRDISPDPKPKPRLMSDNQRLSPISDTSDHGDDSKKKKKKMKINPDGSWTCPECEFENVRDCVECLICGYMEPGKFLVAGYPALASQPANTPEEVLKRIHVSSLDLTTTAEDLALFFSKFGTIVYASIVLGPSKEGRRSKGYGFVSFSNESEATEAAATYHTIKGRAVILNQLKHSETIEKKLESLYDEDSWDEQQKRGAIKDKRRFMCKVKTCGFQGYINTFRRHWKEIHESVGKYLVCPVCDINLPDRMKMRHHLMLTHGVTDNDVTMDNILVNIKIQERRNPYHIDPGTVETEGKQLVEGTGTTISKMMEGAEEISSDEDESAPPKYMCKVIGCEFKGPEKAFKGHWVKRHEFMETYLACPYCGVAGRDHSEVRRHMIASHKVKVDDPILDDALIRSFTKQRINANYLDPGDVESGEKISIPNIKIEPSSPISSNSEIGESPLEEQTVSSMEILEGQRSIGIQKSESKGSMASIEGMEYNPNNMESLKNFLAWTNAEIKKLEKAHNHVQKKLLVLEETKQVNKEEKGAEVDVKIDENEVMEFKVVDEDIDEEIVEIHEDDNDDNEEIQEKGEEIQDEKDEIEGEKGEDLDEKDRDILEENEEMQEKDEILEENEEMQEKDEILEENDEGIIQEEGELQAEIQEHKGNEDDLQEGNDEVILLNDEEIQEKEEIQVEIQEEEELQEQNEEEIQEQNEEDILLNEGEIQEKEEIQAEIQEEEEEILLNEEEMQEKEDIQEETLEENEDEMQEQEEMQEEIEEEMQEKEEMQEEIEEENEEEIQESEEIQEEEEMQEEIQEENEEIPNEEEILNEEEIQEKAEETQEDDEKKEMEDIVEKTVVKKPPAKKTVLRKPRKPVTRTKEPPKRKTTGRVLSECLTAGVPQTGNNPFDSLSTAMMKKP